MTASTPNAANEIAAPLDLLLVNSTTSVARRMVPNAALTRFGLALAKQEPGTKYWFALRLSERVFGVFDAFETEEARQGHVLAGRGVAAGFHGASKRASSAPDAVDAQCIRHRRGATGDERLDQLRECIEPGAGRDRGRK